MHLTLGEHNYRLFFIEKKNIIGELHLANNFFYSSFAEPFSNIYFYFFHKLEKHFPEHLKIEKNYNI